MKIRSLATLAISALALTGAYAQNLKFTVGNAGGMKVAQVFAIESDADFENFTGQTHKVSGQISFDPKAKTGGGKLTVDLSSIDTGIPMRNEHMRSDMWMNTEKFPTATFETTEVRHISGDKYRVIGKLTLHGVTKTIATDATVKYIKENEATKKAMFMGDVVQVKCDFNIRLGDYGVMIPDMAKGKVSETLRARLVVFGYTG